MPKISPIAALTARLERLESDRAADAKVVADAKRHVASLCRQARRVLEDNKRLRIEVAKWYGEWASLSQDDGKADREITRLQEQIQAMARDPSEVIRQESAAAPIEANTFLSKPMPPQDFLSNTKPLQHVPEPMAVIAGATAQPQAMSTYAIEANKILRETNLFIASPLPPQTISWSQIGDSSTWSVTPKAVCVVCRGSKTVWKIGGGRDPCEYCKDAP